jgi:hypothetical protein
MMKIPTSSAHSPFWLPACDVFLTFLEGSMKKLQEILRENLPKPICDAGW